MELSTHIFGKNYRKFLINTQMLMSDDCSSLCDAAASHLSNSTQSADPWSSVVIQVFGLGNPLQEEGFEDSKVVFVIILRFYKYRSSTVF